MATAASKRGKNQGRASRWTEQQVKLLRETVDASATAKDAFQKVAKELGKSPGTVQQKWYALQRAAGKGRRPAAATARKSAGTGARGARSGNARGAASTRPAGRSAAGFDLRGMPVDDLTALARDVKEEVDRRRRELDEASRLFG